MSRVVRIIAFGLGLSGALVASQGPEFSQQYRQRLGGTVDELNRIVSRFDTDAQANGQTRESAIAQLRSNPDDLTKRQGTAIQSNVDRLRRLQAQRQAMIEAGPFSRMALMVSDADRDILARTYVDFEPAVPVTQEGLLSALAGFVLLWGGFLLLAVFIRSFRRRHRASATVRA